MEHEPVTFEVMPPLEYVRGDGKPFWRPCIRRVVGSEIPEELAMTEDYHGWSGMLQRGWETLNPDCASSFLRQKKSPKLYSSRKKAIRVSKRVVKKYNKEELMFIRKV